MLDSSGLTPPPGSLKDRASGVWQVVGRHPIFWPENHLSFSGPNICRPARGIGVNAVATLYGHRTDFAGALHTF